MNSVFLRAFVGGAPSSSGRARRAVIATCGGVFLLALSLRLAGISNVLPYVWHPDETRNERVSLQVSRAPTESPGFFSYPSLLFYVQAVVIRVDEWVTGNKVRATKVVTQGNARALENSHLLLGRAVTAVLSAATAVLASVMAIDAGAPLVVAMLAGLSLALSPLAVEHGAFITPDAYASLFAMAALWAALRISYLSELRYYVLGGLFIGFAAGSKYNVGLVAVAVVTAHWYREGFRRTFDRKLLLAAAISALTFVVTTPFAILDHARFRGGLSYEAMHYRTGHLGAEGSAFVNYLNALWIGCGPWALFSIAALPSRRERTRNLVVAVVPFTVLYLAFISSFEAHFSRNALPLVAPLITIGVIGAADVFRPSDDPVGGHGLRRWAPLGLLTLFAVTAVVHALSVVKRLRDDRTNFRAPAEHWITDHVKARSKIALEAYGPWVDPHRYRIRATRTILELSDRELSGIDYAVLSEGIYGRFFAQEARYPKECERYRTLMARFCEKATFRDPPGQAIRIFDVGCVSGTTERAPESSPHEDTEP